MRPSNSPKREPEPVEGEEPPEWLLLLGVGGLALGIVARPIGGPIGAVLGDIGCATTGTGAFVFVGLLIRWLYPRKHKDRG